MYKDVTVKIPNSLNNGSLEPNWKTKNFCVEVFNNQLARQIKLNNVRLPIVDFLELVIGYLELKLMKLLFETDIYKL